VPRYLPSNSIVALRRAFGAFCCDISNFVIGDNFKFQIPDLRDSF